MIPHIQLRHDPLAPDSWWSVPWIATAIVMLAIGCLCFLCSFEAATKEARRWGAGLLLLNSHGRGIRTWQNASAISDRLPEKRRRRRMGSAGARGQFCLIKIGPATMGKCTTKMYTGSCATSGIGAPHGLVRALHPGQVL